MNKFIELLKVYGDPKILAIAVLGFASGIPLALTGSSLAVWLTEAGIDKTSIGLFAAVATPYTLKFLWSPIVDQTPIPYLTTRFGRRRGWLFLTQAQLFASIIAMAFADVQGHVFMLAVYALVVSFFSATQDIVIDAYRVEYLPPDEQGAGAAASVFGYRVGMIASGAGALLLADHYNWQTAYIVMAFLLLVGTLVVFKCGEPKASVENTVVKTNLTDWFNQSVINPFSDFIKREKWLTILLFVVAFKVGDAFLGAMTSPFYINLGFTKTEIATIAKTYGLIATLAGAFFGGSLVSKMGLAKSLWITAILQLLSNLFFILQNHAGNNLYYLGVTITVENFTGGMGTAAFVAFLSSLCNFQYTATQYALLSSFAAVGRTWLSTPSGYFAEHFGWDIFFLLSALVALPGIYLLRYVTDLIENDEVDREKLKAALAAEN